jgi:phage I-like protein
MNASAITLHASSLDGQIPEWVHLVPAGTFRGADGRGPFTLEDADAVISSSMSTGKLPVDENHAIDLAAPKGGPSPARGWIVEMQARTDGIWGRTEWTAAGKALLTDLSYRGISPCISTTREGGRVVRVLRASLVNDPNLPLKTLHSQGTTAMDFLARIAAAIGLTVATEEAALAAVASMHTAQSRVAALIKAAGRPENETLEGSLTAIETSLQAAEADRKKIAVASGLKEGAGADEIVTSLQAALSGKGDAEDLRKTVISLQSQIQTLTASTAKDKATAVVDAAIAAGKPIKPLRDHYITRHAQDPAGVEKELAALASIHAGGLTPRDPNAGAGTPGSLSADEAEVCELMGIDQAAFAKSKAELETARL